MAFELGCQELSKQISKISTHYSYSPPPTATAELVAFPPPWASLIEIAWPPSVACDYKLMINRDQS